MVAETLEKHYADDPAQRTPIFDLWLKAGHVEKVLTYATGAVKQQFEISNERYGLQIIDDTFELVKANFPEKTRLLLEIRRGEAYFRLSDYPRALEILEQTLSTVREHEMVQEEIQGLHLLGQVYDELGEFEKSAKYLIEGLEKGQATNNTMAEASLYITLSNIYRKQGQFDESEQATKTALAIYEKLEKQCEKAACLNVLDTYRRQQLPWKRMCQT